MPIYPKGEHSVDCPPLFRSRDTKQPVEFSEAFCDRLMEYAETVIPSTLADSADTPATETLSLAMEQSTSP